MKRLLKILSAALAILLLAACTVKVEVSREPIDRRYTAQGYFTTVTVLYTYGGNGVLVPIPQVRAVYHDERYEILYLVTYDDGTSATFWEPVDKAEYDDFLP